MNLKLLFAPAIMLCTMTSINAQCLNGGCEVGLSRSNVKDGVFIGNYEGGKKDGLGISYLYNPKGQTASYVTYMEGEKVGVEYLKEENNSTQTVVHTFKSYSNGSVIYPAFRITKKDSKTNMDVAFDEKSGWEKYDGDKAKGDLQIKSVMHDGSPAFIAFNGKNQTMAISATISSINLLSSEASEKYYNPLQIDLKGERLLVDVFPKVGADETSFRTSTNWDMNNPEDGVWIYKRYFNNELSYKYMYEDVLELPSQQAIKQQKVQKALDFVAEQVEEYNFEKGYKGKAQDFIDILDDIKYRAENKGLAMTTTYDLLMIELYLRKGDKKKSLYYAQSAYEKSPTSYDSINTLVSTKFSDHIDIVKNLKKSDTGLALSEN